MAAGSGDQKREYRALPAGGHTNHFSRFRRARKETQCRWFMPAVRCPSVGKICLALLQGYNVGARPPSFVKGLLHPMRARQPAGRFAGDHALLMLGLVACWRALFYPRLRWCWRKYVFNQLKSRLKRYLNSSDFRVCRHDPPFSGCSRCVILSDCSTSDCRLALAFERNWRDHGLGALSVLMNLMGSPSSACYR